MPDAANVIAGPGKTFFALVTNAPALAFLEGIPDLSEAPLEADWLAAGFEEGGYTDDGVEFMHGNTFKDINVDEELDPVQQLLTGQKTEVKFKMAEATIENLSKGIAGSTITTPSGKKILRWGSPSSSQIKEYLIGFQGPSPNGSDTRVIGIFRAKNVQAVGHKYQRTDKVTYDVNFTALADSGQQAGEKVGFVVDFEDVSSGS